jgi:hypothetical protein
MSSGLLAQFFSAQAPFTGWEEVIGEVESDSDT